ncbi:MAG: CRTAC1 family protein [Planctomycetota bacterium]
MQLPLFALCLASPLAGQYPHQLEFTEVSHQVGLGFTLDVHIDHPVEPMSGGGSAADINGDGLVDIFIPSMGVHRDRIFYGLPNDRFDEQVPTIIGATPRYRGVGSTLGDYDNDGLVDIYVTSYGDMGGPASPGSNRLYRNNGDGSFTQMAAAAGVSFGAPLQADGFGCCFGDYDLDGDLDLFVCGWEAASEGNRLYRNEGDGTFTDQTHAAGINTVAIRGFAPRWTDLNGDRYPELLIAGDFGTTSIYSNNTDGTFTDRTPGLHPDKAHYGMGQTVGDFDSDGYLDWYVTSIYFDNPTPFVPNGNRMHIYEGPDSPLEATPESSGVVNGGWGWGTVAADFDLDSHCDVAEVNGWDDPEFLNESSFLFMNNGDATFEEEGQLRGFDDTNEGRGLLTFDYQNDGDMDLIVFNNEGPVHLYRNDYDGLNNFLRVDVDTSANSALAPGGFGTNIEIEVDGHRRVQFLDGGSTYLGCGQMTAHFGLKAEDQVDKLTIQWADGFRTVMEDVAADQILEIAAVEPLVQDADIHRTQPFTSTVSGLLPGEQVLFLGSISGTTPFGMTRPSWGGLHINLRAPVFYIGTSDADGDGVAEVTRTLGQWFPPVTMWTQAVIVRGQDGADTIKTNTVERQVQP